MNKKLIGACCISFVAGLGSGFLISREYLKKKMDAEREEEIAEIKKGYEKIFEHSKKIKKAIDELTNDDSIFVEPTEEEKKEYENIAKENGYTNYSKVSMPSQELVKSVEEDPEHPYVISPENYGEFEDYSQVEFHYYSDMVLVDDVGCIVDDISEIIGDDSLDRFGEYEEDAVYVRNDRIKSDIAVFRDERAWKEVCGY